MKEWTSMLLLPYFLWWTQCVLPVVKGHGRLMEPPSRSSMWRLGYNTPANYDDNQLFCGGVGVQYSPGIDGKCGVCGDPWNGPRKHEAGGMYATGKIVRNYVTGQVINVTVDLTANHKGYFEFRLCRKDDPFQKSTWDCLNQNVLKLADSGSTRFPVTANGGQPQFHIKLRLPDNLHCKACMLQWKYNAGNSWGVGGSGVGCVGCGNQEQFYGCADVAIAGPGGGQTLLGAANHTGSGAVSLSKPAALSVFLIHLTAFFTVMSMLFHVWV